MAIPTTRPKLKKAFKKARVIAPLYTSGPVASTADGERLATCVGEEVILTNVNTGEECCRFSGDTESITSLCITQSGKYLLVFSASLSLRIYELPQEDSTEEKIKPIRTIGRAHDAPVHVCVSDPTSTLLASGSADGIVKVWDIAHGYVTHVFKGHGGVVSALAFNYPQDPTSVGQNGPIRLVTACVDTYIRIFNLTDGASTSSGGGKAEAILEGHVSVPRGLDVSLDGKWLISGGRDSVVLLWDLQPTQTSTKSSKKTGKGKNAGPPPQLVKTIVALERVEAVGFIKRQSEFHQSLETLQFYVGGQKGLVTVREVGDEAATFSLGDKRIRALSEDEEEQRQIVDILYSPSAETLISVHADQNIMVYSLAQQRLKKQLIGYNDEIVDSRFLRATSSSETSLLALATNSALIRIYSPKTLDARLLEGHTDIVLALDTSADGVFLASGSKDRDVRIWAPRKAVDEESSWGYSCVAICKGHAESVGAIAMSRVKEDPEKGPRFMFTGSQDRTIKMWDLSSVTADVSGEEDIVQCRSLTTHKAHEKDINALDVSPNDKLLVSGSQDRTAKVYAIDYSRSSNNSVKGELKLIGTCKGHKRGVWTVRFCRTNKVLATGSGDKTIKLWNLDDLSCIKTFEGHTNSVLRVDFFNAGMQLISTASDGLVKVWGIQDEECNATLDNHEDKVWALAVASDEKTIVSGGADSVVTFWEDCTAETELEQDVRRAELVLKDQEFQNYVGLGDYKRAIQLALSLGQPGRLLKLFRDVIASNAEDPDSATGNRLLSEIVQTLEGADFVKLLGFVRTWNTSAKTSAVAQTILHAIVKQKSADEVMQFFKDETAIKNLNFGPEKISAMSTASSGDALKELVEALIPYSQRHLSRMERLLQESYVVDFILGEMDNGMFDNGVESEDESMEVD